MNDTERTQMIEAVESALGHAYRYGRMIAVVLDDDGQITTDVQNPRGGIVCLDRVSDVLGDAWDEGLPQNEPEHVHSNVWTRDATDEVDAALTEGATWWVDAYGADALADARWQDDNRA